MSRRAALERTKGPRFLTGRGIPVFVEVSHALPLVDVEVVFRRGSLTDPEGKEGLTRLTAGLMRRGPRGITADAFDELLEGLGATLGVSVSAEAVRVQGAVLRRNLPQYLELIGRILVQPALRPADFSRLRRKSVAELVELRDHDRALAALAFRRALYGAHPYGRPVSGRIETVSAITRADVVAQHQRLVRAGGMLIGVAGDVTEEALRPLLEAAFADIPSGRLPAVTRALPRGKRGVHVVVVDKPQRTQTQLYMGSLGIAITDPDYHALLVANTAFGGTFTSRLMKEVRSERGWSYGASSRFGTDRLPEPWSMWTHPAAAQLVDCMKLQLDLRRAWIEEGLGADEVRRSKQFLIKGHAFDLETAQKRLDPQLEVAFYGLPVDWHPGFPKWVRAVTRNAANAAVQRHLHVPDLTIAMVATVDEPLLASLRALDGVRDVRVISVEEV